jgi:transposase InsO family protein
MQKAKRMVLVDERLLGSNPMMQHFQNKQDQSWKQPTEDSVKTSISKKLKATLDNPDVPDDVKAKRYSHDLNRFLQTKSKVPALTIEDLLDLKEEPTVDELLDLKEPVQKEETPSHKKSHKKSKKRASSRIKKNPQRYADIDWERWGNVKATYYEASEPGSYGGVRTLARYSGMPVKTVKGWLETQDLYTLHKPVVKKFPRRKTFSKGIDDLFQADLADMRNSASSNDGNSYILTCIDVFSRYAFAMPVKDKRGSTVAAAFEKIFAERVPNMLQTDRGTEFYNVQVQELFKKNGVRHYSSLNDDIKAALVERFNRTLKSRLFKYMTRSHTKRWIDVIDDVVHSYNRSHHRSIGTAPIDVTSENEDEVARRQYPPKPPFKYRYDVGDRVRIVKYKHVNPTHPVTYGLADLTGEHIRGKFYEQQIQKVTGDDDVYEVEKVLKTRKRGGKVEYFVKWRGYPDKFNSWVTDVFKP